MNNKKNPTRAKVKELLFTLPERWKIFVGTKEALASGAAVVKLTNVV